MTAVEVFYQNVADVLNVNNPYSYDNITHGGLYRTRWNNRKPGNGRFEGFGLIRYFGPNMIHVSLTNPVSVNQVFEDSEEFLTWLKKTVALSN